MPVLLLNWLLYADPRVAPICRSRLGSITPIIYWLPHADHRLAPIRRSVTSVEKAALKPLPVVQFDVGEWRQAKLHPDCYIQLESVYYSAPHIHRGKVLRVKVTEHHVEIFLELERLAIHPRCRHRDGRRIKIEAHFPPASQAYYEATPQKLLSQSRFIHPELHRLVVDLFNADVYGNIRRVQGLVRSAAKELQTQGRERAGVHLEAAIAQMRHFDKVRVPYFQMLLTQARHHKPGPTDLTREIVRLPGNPMLRYVRDASVAVDPAQPKQEKLI